MLGLDDGLIVGDIVDVTLEGDLVGETLGGVLGLGLGDVLLVGDIVGITLGQVWNNVDTNINQH